jgi:hypothetical protein
MRRRRTRRWNYARINPKLAKAQRAYCRANARWHKKLEKLAAKYQEEALKRGLEILKTNKSNGEFADSRQRPARAAKTAASSVIPNRGSRIQKNHRSPKIMSDNLETAEEAAVFDVNRQIAMQQSAARARFEQQRLEAERVRTCLVRIQNPKPDTIVQISFESDPFAGLPVDPNHECFPMPAPANVFGMENCPTGFRMPPGFQESGGPREPAPAPVPPESMTQQGIPAPNCTPPVMAVTPPPAQTPAPVSPASPVNPAF